MNIKRFTAGVLAAATVFTASAATFEGGIPLFSQTALTAEAATINNIAIYYSGDIYACNNIQYRLNKTTKEAVILGKTPKNPSGGTVTLGDVVIPGQVVVQSGSFAGTYKVVEISKQAFKGSEIKSIDLRDCWAMKSISNEAFLNCTSLKTVRLSSAITNMYSGAFQGCTALTTFDFNGNNNIKDIPIYFLQGCKLLTSVQIPYSVTWIRNGAFSGTGLKEVKISNNVTTVDLSAFAGCKSLKTVTFEAGSTKKLSLGRYSFAFNTALETVKFNRENIDSQINAFEDINDNVSMQGNGSTSYTQSVAKKLLSLWGLTYKTSYTNAEKKQFFTDLAKKVGSYVKAADIKEEGCAATVISVKKGTCGGYARVFYNCCIAAGVPNTDVLVGGDSHCHAWNYVKYGGYWYQVDCGWSRYCENAQQYYNLLKTWKDKNGNVPTAHRPENWIVCVDNMTGAEDENHYNNPYCKNFDQVLREGKANGITITGKRAGYPISNY